MLKMCLGNLAEHLGVFVEMTHFLERAKKVKDETMGDELCQPAFFKIKKSTLGLSVVTSEN